MTTAEIAQRDRSIKKALETLDTVSAGLSEGALFDQVERMVGVHLTVGERKSYLQRMVDKEWIYDYRDKLTDEVKFAISETGRTAMFAL